MGAAHRSGRAHARSLYSPSSPPDLKTNVNEIQTRMDMQQQPSSEGNTGPTAKRADRPLAAGAWARAGSSADGSLHANTETKSPLISKGRAGPRTASGSIERTTAQSSDGKEVADGAVAVEAARRCSVMCSVHQDGPPPVGAGAGRSHRVPRRVPRRTGPSAGTSTHH